MPQARWASATATYGTAGSYPYKKVEAITIRAPVANVKEGSKSFRKNHEINDERIIESETANPLRILSAYLTTSAMTSPP